MTFLPHTASTYDDKIGLKQFVTAPICAAYNRQYRRDNTGAQSSQSQYSAIATDQESQQLPPATESSSRQRSTTPYSVYPQDTMTYQRPTAEPAQPWPRSASVGYSAASNLPSRPNTSEPPASQRRYRYQQSGRSDLGDHGLDGAPVIPTDMGYGEREVEGEVEEGGGEEVEGEVEGEGEGVEGEGTSCCDGVLSFPDVASVLGDVCSEIGSCFKGCCCDSEGKCECVLPFD